MIGPVDGLPGPAQKVRLQLHIRRLQKGEFFRAAPVAFAVVLVHEKGRCIRVLAGRGHRFDDVVVVPDVSGVLAVRGPESNWGPMTSWSLRIENSTPELKSTSSLQQPAESPVTATAAAVLGSQFEAADVPAQVG
ncbi:hypothetical protein AB0G20_03045 [Streptomyces sp. NPDC024017]|uniref:hypothetical protein n=1 Tax=Streptomyces sp. NPDC024017 TaxID=3154326 RepID=UPI0034068C25